MRWFMFLCLLAACNTPTQRFSAQPVKTIQVGKSTFDVRVLGSEAQAIRTNMEYAPNWRFTAGRFLIAIEQTTGCTVAQKSLRGDQVVMEAALVCDGKRPAPVFEQARFECEVEGTLAPDAGFMLCKEIVPLAQPLAIK